MTQTVISEKVQGTFGWMDGLMVLARGSQMGVCKPFGACEGLPYQSSPAIKGIFFQIEKKHSNFWASVLVCMPMGEVYFTQPSVIFIY